MRIVVGADHRGYALKDVIAQDLRAAGNEVADVGTHNEDSVDYPDLAVAVGKAIQSGQAERGLLLCGSGVGAVIAANKLPGIRAGLCHDTYSARQGVEHDDMNTLCLGTLVVGEKLALEIVHTFIAARFSGEERYRRRLAKGAALEKTQGVKG